MKLFIEQSYGKPKVPAETHVDDMPNKSQKIQVLAICGAFIIWLLLGLRSLKSVDLGYHLVYGEHFLSAGQIVDSPFGIFLKEKTSKLEPVPAAISSIKTG